MPNLRDLQIQHALFLLRYSNGVDQEIQALLTDLEKKTVAKLGERLAGIEKRGADLGPTVTKRLQKTIDEIQAVQATSYGAVANSLEKNLTELAGDEIDFAAKALSSSTGVDATAALASPQRLKSIVTERPIQGKFLAPFVKGAEESTKARVEQAIRLGMADGSSVDDMARAVRAEMGKSKASARAIVRTSVNSISTDAQMESFAKNPRVVKAWQFVSTLDSRTTPICASLSNRIFPVGEGPTPPRHPNCRSTIVAVTDLDEWGITEAQLKRDGEGKITKTPPDSDPTFDQWLRGKSEATQNQVLGTTRADLWRDGKYSLQDFVRNNNETISLSDLRKTHPKANIIREANVLAAVPKPRPDFSPINTAVTDETVRIRSRLEIQKELRPKMEAAKAAHPFKFSEFRGGEKTFGKVQFSTEFDDATVSMIQAILPEVDAITDAFKVPRLRGIISRTGSFSASMGDSVMNINPRIFNGYATKIGGTDSKTDFPKLKAAIEATREEYSAAIAVANKAIDAGDYPLYREKQAIARKIGQRFDRERKKYNQLARNEAVKKAIDERPASTWKLGDELADRPSGSQNYFEGMDKARTVMFHELAHLIHQERGRTGHRRNGLPPLELRLEEMFTRLRQADRKAFFETLPSGYAETNSKEWFAENFAMFAMGRKDLVHPELSALIEELLDD